VTQRLRDQGTDRPGPPSRQIPGGVSSKLDAPGEEASLTVEPGFALRIASIVPFLLVTLLGIVALMGWFLVVFLGGGGRDPIEVLVASGTVRHTLPQVAQAIGLGIPVLGITLLSMWAAMHGLARSSGRLFWRVTEFVFSLLTAVLLLVAVTKPDFVTQLGVSGRQWFVAFGILGYTLVVCRLRERMWVKASDDDGSEEVCSIP
jgi:hypothetical protein